MVFMSSATLFAADAVMVLYGELNDRVGPVACLGVGAATSLASLVALWATARVARTDGLWFAGLAQGHKGVL